MQYFTVFYFKRYGEAELMYQQYNQDEDKVLMDTYKTEMLKYAHELAELAPTSALAKQVIEVFGNQ